MLNGSSEYKTAAAFRRALDDRLKDVAKSSGRPKPELLREFLFQRFLTLVFAVPDGPWILKGGVGLLMRVPPARFSKDLDLLHAEGPTAEEAVAELRVLAARRDGDHLWFEIGDAVENNQHQNPVAEVLVTAYFGVSEYAKFPIDLALKPNLVAAPERHRPAPIVNIPGLEPPPEIWIYPITDQIADKVCAMYQGYGEEKKKPSSRYRDLIDLVLIVSTLEFEAAGVAKALASEATRREMELPSAMTSPAPEWVDGYRRYASKTKIDPELHGLDEALAFVGPCLNPLLEGTRGSGRWRPNVGWVD